MKCCYLEDGTMAAAWVVGDIFLSVEIATLVRRSAEEATSYDEAQVLLACFDLTLPPLPEVNSEQAP